MSDEARDPLLPRARRGRDVTHHLGDLVQRAGEAPTGLDDEPVAEEGVQDQGDGDAPDADPGLENDAQTQPTFAVLWNVNDYHAHVERPVPPVEERAVMLVGRPLHLVHPEREYGGRKADVRYAQDQVAGGEHDVLVEARDLAEMVLEREGEAKSCVSDPSRPQAEAYHVVATHVGVCQVSRHREKHLGHSVHHKTPRKDVLGSDYDLEHLR